EDRPPDRARPTQDHDRVKSEGERGDPPFRVDDPTVENDQHAGHGPHRTAEHERLQFVDHDVLTKSSRRVLIFTNRPQHPTPRTPDEGPDEQTRQQCQTPGPQHRPELLTAEHETSPEAISPGTMRNEVVIVEPEFGNEPAEAPSPTGEFLTRPCFDDQ